RAGPVRGANSTPDRGPAVQPFLALPLLLLPALVPALATLAREGRAHRPGAAEEAAAQSPAGLAREPRPAPGARSSRRSEPARQAARERVERGLLPLRA